MSDEKTRVKLIAWAAAGNPRYCLLSGPGIIRWFRGPAYALAFARRRGWEVVE